MTIDATGYATGYAGLLAAPRGPGWRVVRVYEMHARWTPYRGRKTLEPRDSWWRAEADYADPRDMPPGAQVPDYMRFAHRPTRDEAMAAVMDLCRADPDWPLVLDGPPA